MTCKYIGVKSLVILTHNLKKVWKYTNRVSRYKVKPLNREIRSQWPRTTSGSKVLSYANILWKKFVHKPFEYRDIRQKSLNREIRSQWPISILGSKVWSYSLIIWKKYENILIECQDIRQNHWTVKLGHTDLGLLQGQRSCHTQTYFERSLFINHLSTEI